MTARQTSDPRAVFDALYRATRADLLAETYMTAWRKLDAIPVGPAAQPWLYGVARNLLLRSARQRHVASALTERLAGELRSAQSTSTADQHRHEALRRALAHLSEQDREILTLHAWEGLAPRQIAQVIGANPNIVRIRLHRARSRMRKRLEHPDEPITRSRPTTGRTSSARPAA